MFLSVINSLTHTHPHTCMHIALCIALRVLYLDTKSLISDITPKSFLINSSPGTKLAFGHGRCSHTSWAAVVGQRNADGCSFPFLISFPICPHPLYFSPPAFILSLSFQPPLNLHHFYPACSAVLAGVSAVSQHQSSGQVRVPSQSGRVSTGIKAWRLAFSLVSSLIHSQGLDHHTHTDTRAGVVGSQGNSGICRLIVFAFVSNHQFTPKHSVIICFSSFFDIMISL